MAYKPKHVQSNVYKAIWWDFSEIGDELEAIRLDCAPETRHNETYPLSWILRAPGLTMHEGTWKKGDEEDGKRPITRAFEACGITAGVSIAKLAGYNDSSTVSAWDIRTMRAGTIQERLFPTLCDAYVTARKKSPMVYSAAYALDALEREDFTTRGTDGKPHGEKTRHDLQYWVDWHRKGIEMEAIWVLLRGDLNASPYIRGDISDTITDAHWRLVTIYAATLLDGQIDSDEIATLGRVATAILAQHVATHKGTDWAALDPVCLSTERRGLDWNSSIRRQNRAFEERQSENSKIEGAMFRYATTRYLQTLEAACHAELERREALGKGWYDPRTDAEDTPPQ